MLVRFIFICMGVVTLSIINIVSQPMVKGIEKSHEEIVARNSESAQSLDASDETASFNPESLNDIQTAAGEPSVNVQAAADDHKNMSFGTAFQNKAPAALDDPADDDASQRLQAF